MTALLRGGSFWLVQTSFSTYPAIHRSGLRRVLALDVAHTHLLEVVHTYPARVEHADSGARYLVAVAAEPEQTSL